MAQGDFIVPLPVTKRLNYLDENLGSVNITLSEDELKKLDEAAPLGFTKGTRYPERSMSAVNR